MTDLVFNVHECRGMGMPLFLRAVGAWQKLGQSRMWRFFTKDRAAARRSFDDVLTWDFDRHVMAHGEAVDTAAQPLLAAALSAALP